MRTFQTIHDCNHRVGKTIPNYVQFPCFSISSLECNYGVPQPTLFFCWQPLRKDREYLIQFTQIWQIAEWISCTNISVTMHTSLTVVSDFHSVLFSAFYSKGVNTKEEEIKLWQMVLSVWLLLSSAGPVVSKVRAVKMVLSIKWITKCRLPACFLHKT